MSWTDAAVADRLTAAFERIHRERMAGLPILQPGLAVAVVGARAWRGHWLGVLVTPWCMNLVLVPAVGSDLARDAEGMTWALSFPAGRFEFLVSTVEGLGTIAACSLFSPMHAFADQAAAEATAAAVMTTLFQSAEEPGGPGDAAGRPPAAPTRVGISRRQLLRGSFGADGT